jgi:hypothetical protein
MKLNKKIIGWTLIVFFLIFSFYVWVNQYSVFASQGSCSAFIYKYGIGVLSLLKIGPLIALSIYPGLEYIWPSKSLYDIEGGCSIGTYVVPGDIIVFAIAVLVIGIVMISRKPKMNGLYINK